MNRLQLYGIKNCDTVRKARKWLEQHQLDYEFMDLREDTLSHELIAQWLTQVELDTLVNKKSTSWRGLTAEQQDDLNQNSAPQLLMETPTLIKRPVLVTAAGIHIGFKPAQYQELLL